MLTSNAAKVIQMAVIMSLSYMSAHHSEHVACQPEAAQALRVGPRAGILAAHSRQQLHG